MNATTAAAATAQADQVAATLRDRRSTHSATGCDAFDPCAGCRADRALVQMARAQARVPQQRTA